MLSRGAWELVECSVSGNVNGAPALLEEEVQRVPKSSLYSIGEVHRRAGAMKSPRGMLGQCFLAKQGSGKQSHWQASVRLPAFPGEQLSH